MKVRISKLAALIVATVLTAGSTLLVAQSASSSPYRLHPVYQTNDDGDGGAIARAEREALALQTEQLQRIRPVRRPARPRPSGPAARRNIAPNAVTAAATPGDGFTYFPSASAVDGRMMAHTGQPSLGGVSDTITVQLAVPAGTPNLVIGVFDPDTGGTWDSGTGTVLRYRLFADPLGSGGPQVDTTRFSTDPIPASLNDQWWQISVPTSAAAMAPNGNFFYRFEITNTTPGSAGINAFKLRCNGTLAILPGAFSILCSSYGGGYLKLYPSYPSLSPTNYDGKFDVHVFVPTFEQSLRFWDGDADLINDTDDPDTNVQPVWAASNTVLDGAYPGKTADNSPHAVFQRIPTGGGNVSIMVTDPSGATFTNSDPSGNLEWEALTIARDGSGDWAGTPAPAPAFPTYLPRGTYKLTYDGLDVANTVNIRVAGEVFGVTDGGIPCPPLQRYDVGGTVWRDLNADGSINSVTVGNGSNAITFNEMGIPDVEVSIRADYVSAEGLAPDGIFDEVFTTQITNGSGAYALPGMRPGTYTVQVNPLSAPLQLLNQTFDIDGVLASPHAAVFTVVNTNFTQVNFGYRGGFRTHTAFQWGTPDQLANTIQKNLNSKIYTSALRVGLDPGFEIVIASHIHTTNYLPDEGTPTALTQDYMNPNGAGTNSRSLGSEATTLALNIRANDEAANSSELLALGFNPDFDTLKIADPTGMMPNIFEGLTVAQFMTEMNQALNGQLGVGAGSATYQEFVDAARLINANFLDGVADDGYLVLP